MTADSKPDPAEPTRAAATSNLHRVVPFAKTLGLEAIEMSADRVELVGAWREDRCTGVGLLHGGYLMALADTAGATLTALGLPPGAGGTTTVEAKTNMIRGVRAGNVRAVASAIHRGRRTVVVQTDVFDCEDRLVSRTLQTQLVL